MSNEALIRQVQKLKISLQEIEEQLTQGTEVPMAVLSDFKMAVDHTRMTVWAILSTRETDQFEVTAAVARFRLKRCEEMCQNIVSDINSNELTIDAPELQQFYRVAQETVARIDRLYKQGN